MQYFGPDKTIGQMRIFNFGSSSDSGVAGDPYFSSVDLLIVADTEQNSYQDWSNNKHVVTKIRTVSIKNLEGKPVFLFEGNAEDRYNDVNGVLQTFVSPLGVGDFTLECWGAYTPTSKSNARLYELGEIDSERVSIIPKTGSSSGGVFMGGSIIGYINENYNDSILRHFCLMRKNGITSYSVNGSLIFESSAIKNITAQYLIIGAEYCISSPLQGYVQQLRITKAARYDSRGFEPDLVFPTT